MGFIHMLVTLIKQWFRVILLIILITVVGFLLSLNIQAIANKTFGKRHPITLVPRPRKIPVAKVRKVFVNPVAVARSNITLPKRVWAYNFVNSSGHRITGKDLKVSSNLLFYLRYPITNFTRINDKTVKKFVFATGVSSDNFFEWDMNVATMQQYFPRHKVFYYDVGLKPDEVEKIKTWCRVIYRYFDFSRYPKHVKEIGVRAYKAIIIHMLLNEFRAVFWMDSRTIVRSPYFSPVYDKIYNFVRGNGGFLFFHDAQSTIADVTDPQTWDYLPTDRDKMETTPVFSAGAFLVYRTQSVYKNIIRWYMLCSLVRECIAPENGLRHAYGKSVLNTLVANHFDFYSRSYFSKLLSIVTIKVPWRRWKMVEHFPFKIKYKPFCLGKSNSTNVTRST